MLLELSAIPLGRGRSISSDIADLVKIFDASGLDYRLPRCRRIGRTAQRVRASPS
jgi:uncharacterized protein YqgV (UPF0045/DUF77 family)